VAKRFTEIAKIAEDWDKRRASKSSKDAKH